MNIERTYHSILANSYNIIIQRFVNSDGRKESSFAGQWIRLSGTGETVPDDLGKREKNR